MSDADVFAKLNNFLTTEDDSFKYDSFDTLDESITKENVNDSQEKSQNVESKIPEAEHVPKTRRSKRGRQTNLLNSQNSTNDDVFDLTVGYDYSLRSNKSRRKLADQIAVTHIQEEIDLSAMMSPMNPSVSNVRGKRGGRKPRAPRKVSYKKALEILNASIPDIVSTPQPIVTSQVERSNSNSSCDFAVDLTGEVELSDIHNKNPLFQNVKTTKDKSKKNYKEECSIDLDEDIELININVKIGGKIRVYRIKLEQRFYDLFKLISDDEDVPVCNVILFNGDKRINSEDSPDSIGHRISTIYTCRLMEASSVTVNKKDLIELKFQSDKWKKPISLKVSRFESFLSHIKLLCDQVNFKPEQFSLKFDGDDINLSNTPIELEFEGGEIIDCRVKI